MKTVLEGFGPTERVVFLERPNRFLLVAQRQSGERMDVHVPDPGRLRELLRPGNDLLVMPAPEGSARKTRWSLLAALDSTGWILVNTSFHREIARRIFSSSRSPFGECSSIRAEVTAPSGSSRLDFLLDGRWVEVKGCTLRKGRTAMFPDAPTSRGRKHLRELTVLASSGQRAAVVFLVFVREVDRFMPNSETDPDFAEAMERAIEAGVEFRALQLSFNGQSLDWVGELPVTLPRER